MPPAGPRGTRGRLTDPVLWLFVGAYVGHNWGLFICWGWLAPFLVVVARVQGWEAAPATDIGTILTGSTILASGFVSIWAARLSDRVGRVPVILTALAASAACSLSIGWLLREPFPLLGAVAFVYGVAALGESAVYTTGITEVAPPHLVGTALGLQALTGFAASAISPALFGRILDLTNGAGEIRRIGYAVLWGPAFMSASLGSIAALAAALSLRRRLVPKGRA